MATDKYDYTKGQISALDKNHSEYRFFQFQKFMTLRKQEFINSVKFEGDKDFTLAKQRIFLKLLFEFGYAGVVNPEKIVKSKITDEQLDIINILEFDLKNIVKKELGSHVPIAVFPTHWNENERVIKGTGVTAPRHNLGKKTYQIDETNTAIAHFNQNHLSGYWWWLIPAYISSSTDLVIKKRLSLIDAKLVNNKVNNTFRNVNYDNIYDMESSFLELAPNQKSMSGSEANEINIERMLDNKLKKLDLSNGETINDLLEFMKEHEKKIFAEQGKRTNTNEGKNERSITQDFQAMEVHYRILENEMKDQMEMFIDSYEKVFGIRLTLISKIDETIQDLNAQEVAKAGHVEGGNKNGDN